MSMNPYAGVMEISQGLSQGDFSATELATFYLQRIKSSQADTGTFISIDEAGALAAATAA